MAPQPRGTKITDAAIPELAKLPRLAELMITGNPRITDRALERLTPAEGLKTLYLNGAAVTDDGLRYLKELPNLQTVGLYHTVITDKGVEYLAGIQPLRDVNLIHTNITSAALDSLTSLPNLERLETSSEPNFRGRGRGVPETLRSARSRVSTGRHREAIVARSLCALPDAIRYHTMVSDAGRIAGQSS